MEQRPSWEIVHVVCVRSRAQLLLRLVAVLVVAVGIPVAVAGPASAHHPEIVASVDCDGLVSFTASSWVTSDPLKKTNPNIGVYTKQGSTLTKVAQGAFAAPGYSFSGTFSIGSAPSATIVVRADAKWASGAGAGDSRQTTVTAPTDCGTTTITNDCNTATVDLVNTGAAPKTYTVSMTGRANQTKTVAGGSSDKVTFTGLEEDATYTVTVNIGSSTVATKTFTVDCDKPTATVTNDCTQATVRFDNTGNAATTYVITVNGKSTTYTAKKNNVETKSVDVVEDSTNTVTVTWNGTQLATSTFSVDCEKPTAEITPTCTGYTVVLDNSVATKAAKFVVTANGKTSNFWVTKGETRTETVSGFDEGDSLTVSVAIDGDVLDTASFKIDCVQPAAVIKHDCTGYTVDLDNRASKVDVDFTVTVNGAAKTYTVKAGDTAKATGPVVEDQVTTITVSVGKDTIKSEKFTEDCEQPTATLTQDCTSFTIVLDNSKSNVDATYLVTIGDTTTEHVVGKTTKSIVTPAAEDSSRTVKVVFDGTTLVDRTVKIDCEEPAAQITHDCTGYTVVLDNSKSSVAVTFTVTVNGVSTPVSVPANDKKTVTGDVVEDEPTTIAVSVREDTIKSKTFTVDCEKPAASISSDCTSYTIVLDNSKNNVDATYTVTVNGETTTHVVGKTPETITGDVAEGSKNAIEVVSGDVKLASKTFTVDCVKIEHDCTTYTVTLDNTTSDVATTFVVTVNGTPATHTVDAGESVDVTGPVVEDEATTITVTSGDKTIETETFTENCEQPAATITSSCVDYTVTLDNGDSTVPVDFTVTVNGADTVYTLEAGETRSIVTPAAEGSTYDVAVTSGTTLLAEKVIVIDCAKPAAR